MIEMNLTTTKDGEPAVYSERMMEPLKQGRAMQLKNTTASAVEVATWLAQYDILALVTMKTSRYTPTVQLPPQFGGGPSFLWPNQWVLVTPLGYVIYDDLDFQQRFFQGLFGQDPEERAWLAGAVDDTEEKTDD